MPNMTGAIFGSSSAALSTGASQYFTIQDSSSGVTSSNEAVVEAIAPCAFDLSNFYMEITNAPGVGKSWTFTIYKNGSATALSLAISDTNTSNSDNSNTVSFAAGDRIGVQSTPAGTPAALGFHWWNLKFSNTAVQPVMGATLNNPSNTATTYGNIFGMTSWNTTETNRAVIMPTSGTFSNLYVQLLTAPSAGKSRTFTLTVNGTPSALTTSIADTNTSNSDTTHSVTVAAGDRVVLQADPSGTPTSTNGVGWGIQFTPDTYGESFFGKSNTGNPSTSVANYASIMGSEGSWNATETNRSQTVGAFLLRKFYLAVVQAPGSGKSYTYTVRQAGAGTSLAVTISDTNTSGNVTADASLAATDRVAVESSPSGTPTVPTSVMLGVLLAVTTTSTSSSTSASTTSTSISTSSTSSSTSQSTSTSISTSSTSTSVSTSISTSISTSSTSQSTSVSTSISTSSTSESTSISTSISTSSTSTSTTVSVTTSTSSTSISISTSSTSTSVSTSTSISTSSTSSSTSTSLTTSTSSTSMSTSLSTSISTSTSSTSTSISTSTSLSVSSTSTSSTSTSTSTSTTLIDTSYPSGRVVPFHIKGNIRQYRLHIRIPLHR